VERLAKGIVGIVRVPHQVIEHPQQFRLIPNEGDPKGLGDLLVLDGDRLLNPRGSVHAVKRFGIGK
jgi:hypothetical protein